MKIICPVVVWLPRKTKPPVRFPLNQNKYRNAHHRVLYNAKLAFQGEVYPQLRGRVVKTPVRLVYSVWLARRGSDLMNIGSVVDKFLCDALVHAGVIPDDNHRHIRQVEFIFAGIDSKNPRVEVEIQELIDI